MGNGEDTGESMEVWEMLKLQPMITVRGARIYSGMNSTIDVHASSAFQSQSVPQRR
jgi:hypothetical protein